MKLTLRDLLTELDEVRRQRDDALARLAKAALTPVMLVVERDGDDVVMQEIWTTAADAKRIERGVMFGQGTRGTA